MVNIIIVFVVYNMCVYKEPPTTCKRTRAIIHTNERQSYYLFIPFLFFSLPLFNSKSGRLPVG